MAGNKVIRTVATTSSNIVSFSAAPNIVDDVTLTTNAAVLVKGQTNLAQNGIYKVTTVGTGANGVWARTSSPHKYELTAGSVVWVDGGTRQKQLYYTCVGAEPYVPGTTTVWFVSIVGPLRATVATLPAVNTINEGREAFVSDANGGVGTMAFSNGTNWIDVKTGLPVTT